MSLCKEDKKIFNETIHKTKSIEMINFIKFYKTPVPVTILLKNPTAAIVTVLARCQKFEGCLSLGKIQSMLYTISCEVIMYLSPINDIFQLIL